MVAEHLARGARGPGVQPVPGHGGGTSTSSDSAVVTGWNPGACGRLATSPRTWSASTASGPVHVRPAPSDQPR